MRKHDEGYALPFVLVVFVVFSLIATSILTISLNNLKKQQASIQRTQDQYAAQGEIEKVYALLDEYVKANGATINESDVETMCNSTALDGQNPTVVCDKVDGTQVTLKTQCGGTVEIQCVIEVNAGTITYKSYKVVTSGGATS
jgi:type II secretory pathway component PulJ